MRPAKVQKLGLSQALTTTLRAGGGIPNAQSGAVVYGYVADSCQDSNGWCKHDRSHVDMGAPNLRSLGLLENWQNNRIQWQFLDGPAPGYVLRGSVNTIKNVTI